MTLLADVFGYLSVVLRGFKLIGETLTLGGIGFLLLLALPFARELGPSGAELVRRSYALLRWSALVVIAVEAAGLALAAAVLSDSLGFAGIIGAGFVESGLVKICICIAIIVLAEDSRLRHPLLLAALAVGLLATGLATSHASARIDDRFVALGLTLLHRGGAAVWIGGIPYLLIGLKVCASPLARARIGRRFSAMAAGSVAALLASGVGLGFGFIGSMEALYGTAYGAMVLSKSVLFAGLVLLGFMNYRLVGRLLRDPATPTLRLVRFCEVEIGIGFIVLIVAASITSLAPAIDLADHRVTLADYAERFSPRWPNLESPAYQNLAIAQRQAELDRIAAEDAEAPRHRAFVPGGVEPLPRNAADIAWAEYNHHWSGIFVLAIGLLALAERAGVAPWARHWPLLLIGLAFFLFFRSEAESWPIGDIGFLESLRNPEFLQHKFFMLLIVLFGLFEWAVRTGRLPQPGFALVFPLFAAGGSAFLLGHSHSLINAKELLLAEATHLPIALLGVSIAASRWLELRLEPPAARVSAWIWPAGFALVGLILLLYRES
jgi:putative copper resistance protein D